LQKSKIFRLSPSAETAVEISFLSTAPLLMTRLSLGCFLLLDVSYSWMFLTLGCLIQNCRNQDLCALNLAITGS